MDMKRTAIVLAALSGALLAAQPVIAASVEVRYDDLDLTTEEGRKALDQRIDRAAEEVCDASKISVGSKIRSREARECIKQAKRQIEQSLAKITGDDKAGG
jgi:UrcA family protein